MSYNVDSRPFISVIMPVYNCEKFVAIAIESILKQTFTDFEFIIIDDCSSDRSLKIIQHFTDKRIILKRNTVRRGCYYSRNIGIDVARGKYLCGMDGDDISEPERFQKQYQFMEGNPDTGICGSYHKIIPAGFVPKFITVGEQLKVAFLANNYCSHPSLIIRKEFLNKYNLRYNEQYYYASDFDFCARAFRFFKIENIPYVLYQYRRHPEQISSAHSDEQARFSDIIRIRQLIDNLGFDLGEIPVLLHLKLMKRYPVSIRYKVSAEQWIRRILNKNKSRGYYNQELLDRFLKYYLKGTFNT